MGPLDVAALEAVAAAGLGGGSLEDRDRGAGAGVSSGQVGDHWGALVPSVLLSFGGMRGGRRRRHSTGTPAAVSLGSLEALAIEAESRCSISARRAAQVRQQAKQKHREGVESGRGGGRGSRVHNAGHRPGAAGGSDTCGTRRWRSSAVLPGAVGLGNFYGDSLQGLGDGQETGPLGSSRSNHGEDGQVDLKGRDIGD